tara:strand:+ start:3826 stop:4749 length:924 start_codon:yes stop_codon:yes gene_type:complete
LKLNFKQSKMSQIKRYQFLANNDAIIPDCFESIYLNKKIYPNSSFSNENLNTKVIYVSLYPTYLKCKIGNENTLKTKKIVHNGPKGAGILLEDTYTAETYLKKHAKRQLKFINRDMKRLEASFSVSYEYNYGYITEEKCDFLLKTLYKMINKRFEQKNTPHLFMKTWHSKTKDLALLINKKKASLFVIYADNKPISISLNRHEGNSILFSQTHSYDMDFSKFGMGHLDLYMLLNWCINNDFDFLDLGVGLYDYKKKWCNTFYDIEYRIYYDKKSVLAMGIAQSEILKIKTKNAIKSILALYNININE